MVRMCSMTVACATILVAGSVAGAADRAPVASKVAVKAPAVTQNLRSVLPATGASLTGTGAARCLCEGWDNGVWDENDGQVSHLGGGVPSGAMAADDFYLCEGQVHDLKSVSGFLITNSNPALRKAKAILFSDCNSCPAQELYVFTEFSIVSTRDLGGGYYLVEYRFDMANQFEEAERNIVLKGGVYWLALVGKTDNQCATMNMCDISFFATTGDGYIKGSVAKKIQGLPGLPVNQYSFTSSCGGQYGWNSVDDCCIGCTDLAFTICADPCKILIDNGSQISAVAQFASGAPSEKSVSNSSRNTRAADDFVINPCRDFSVCYIEGCVYTNCEGWDGFYEIYANDCKLPDFYFGDSVVAYKDGATKIVDLGYNVVIGGVTLRAYRVEFHDISGLILQKGHTYWISIGAIDTFSFTEKAYFCCNYDCRRIGCLTRFNRGVKLTTAQQGSHPSTPVGWVDAGCDFAFLIAGTYAGTAPGSGSVGTACIADIDGNGSVGVADLFTFLDAWFAGCP